MSFEQLVEDHHRNTFRDNVQMRAQQTRSRLRSTVMEVPGKGEFMSVTDLFGKKRAKKVADRNRSNPDDPTPRSRRGLYRPEAIETGEYCDREDKWDGAMDPMGMLMQSNVAAVARSFDDCILGVVEGDDGVIRVGETGILGNAREGKRLTTTVALPSAQILAEDSDGLTLDKLRDVQKKLRQAEFGMEDDDQFVGVITPEQIDDLIGIAAATGTSLNAFSLEELRSGKPGQLMGFTWVTTLRLPLNDNGKRQCPFYSKRNIVAGVWQDIQGDMWNDTHQKNLPYLYVSAVVDAVRVQDEGVVVVPCTEP